MWLLRVWHVGLDTTETPQIIGHRRLPLGGSFQNSIQSSASRMAMWIRRSHQSLYQCRGEEQMGEMSLLTEIS